ncbi:MAG: GIY-YIG nuclease family protein [Dehalococcoidia bacterium]
MTNYAVYIMTNNSGNTLYIGVTNDLVRRVTEHKAGIGSRFTSRYRTTRLVYFELTEDLGAARERERQLKGWVRRRKIELIANTNARWRDLSDAIGH